MTIGTAQRLAQTQAPGPLTITLVPAARNGLGRLQEHTGLSQADLANCAITWYAYLDTQLRAGYSLTLWNGETGKAYTLSVPAGSPAARGASGLPGTGKAHGTSCAPGLHFQPAQPSWTQAGRSRYRQPPCPVIIPAQPWLTVTSSRGSPAAAPCGGGSADVLLCHPGDRPPAAVTNRKEEPS